MIYLDHNATTCPDPEVVAAVTRCLEATWGNPSSLHAGGQAARAVLQRARTEAARLIGAHPQEIVFTSGGTEADNQVLLGLPAAAGGPRHVVTTAIEHQAVLRPCEVLEAAGWRVTRVAPDRCGRVEAAAVVAALEPDTALVSVMLANNETGVLQPVREIAAAVRPRGIPVHTDAVQALGRVPVVVADLGVDFLSASAHKLHGPKGVGFLYVRKGREWPALLNGGHQESNRRAGTENLPGIAGLGTACGLASARLDVDRRAMGTLRDRFEQGLRLVCPGVCIHGEGVERLPNTTYASFPGIDAVALTMNLDVLGIAVSTGSACTASQRTPPHVLTAMGARPELALSAVRFSLGRGTTTHDIDATLHALADVVQRLSAP